MLGDSLTTSLFDCRGVAQEFLDWAAAEKKKLSVNPRLAAVLFKPRINPDSLRYRDLVLKDAARLGFETRSLEAATGIVVLYPIGGKTKDEDLMDRVSPEKDVEGLHSLNLVYCAQNLQRNGA